MPDPVAPKLGELAFQNTSLVLSDDPNAKSLLDALVEKFNKITPEATPHCVPHNCANVHLASFIEPMPGSVAVSDSPALGIGLSPVLSDIALSDQPVTISLPTETEISGLAGQVCSRLEGVDFVSGDSAGNADFKIKLTLAAAAGPIAAAQTIEFHVGGSYSIRVSRDPADPETIPSWRVTRYCQGPGDGCIDETGIVSVKVRSQFNLKLTGTATAEFEIAGYKFLKTGGAAGVAGTVEASLTMSATSTARMPVTCAAI